MRVVRVHVQVGDDPVAVGERLGLVPAGGPPPAPRVGVEPLERLGDEARSRRPRPPRAPPRPSRSRAASSSARRSSAAAASSGCAATPGGSTIAQPAAAASRRSRRRPSGDGTTIAADRRISARARRGQRRADVDPVAEGDRDRRPRREPARPHDQRLPAGEPAQGAERGADDGQAAGRALDHDQPAASRSGAKRLRSTPAGTTVKAPGKRSRRGRARPRSSRAACRCGRAGGRAGSAAAGTRAARGRRTSPPSSSPPRAARRTRARHGRVEAVDDVEVAASERRRDVRADADRDPDRRARRDRHRARDGDDAVELAALERAAAREQIGRPRRRREHDDAVPAARGAPPRRRRRARSCRAGTDQACGVTRQMRSATAAGL